MDVAAVEVLSDGGVLSLVCPVGDSAESGVVEAWLSFAGCGAAWMMTVRVLVEVRPFWSVTT